MRHSTLICLAMGVFSAVVLVQSSRAQPALNSDPILYTTGDETSSPGAAWANSTLWTNVGGATKAAPAVNNVYELEWNGIDLWGSENNSGTGSGATQVRTPKAAGNQQFPGDSLIVQPGAAFCLLEEGAGSAQGGYAGTSLAPISYAIPTNIFNGSNGLPGLQLNGGCLMLGQAFAFMIQGTINVVGNTTNYL